MITISPHNVLRIATSSAADTEYIVLHSLNSNVTGTISSISYVEVKPIIENAPIVYLSVINVDAALANTITISRRAGAVLSLLFEVELQIGESIIFDGVDWRVYDVDGAIKVSISGSSGGGDASAANQLTIIGHIDTLETLATDIRTSLQLLDNAIAGSELQVDIVSAPTLTVTANAGTDLNTSALALEATLQDVKTSLQLLDNAISGSELQVDVVTLPTGNNIIGQVKLTDGTDVADVLDLTNSNPLTVAIVDGNGDQIISFGGGTQYTEGSTDASITGTAMLMEGAGDTLLPVPGTTADGILVNLGSNNDVVCTATNLDIRDLTFAADKVDASGSVLGAGNNIIGQVKLSDGTDIVDILDLTNSNPLTVAIVDGSGDQITSFGGGTQYQEGDSDATITGTAMMMEGAGNTVVPAQGTVADGLLVNLGLNNDVIVTASDLDIRNLTNTDVVTAELSATDNAVLDAIAASVAAIDTDCTTIIGHVDGIEGLLTTIDGDTGNIVTSVQLLDDTVATLGTDTYTEASSKGLIISAVRRDADTTLVNTTNEYGPLQMDANGRLKVEVFSGEALPVTMTSTTITGTVAVTQSGTWDEVGINDSGNSITVDNGGTFVTQINGDALTALQLIDNIVSGTGANISQVGGTNIDTNSGNKSAGTQRVVIATDQPNLTTDLNVKLIPQTSGGLTTYHLVSAATTNATVVKASAGQLFGWYIYNSNASARKLAFHNSASSPTAGASIFFTMVIPPTSGANAFLETGIAFSSGIAITTVTGLADSDNVAVAANDLIINLFYK